MATKRQPLNSSSSPAGLKIKLRPGAAKASRVSQLEDGGEDVGADSGDDSGLNCGMLKRKQESPWAANILNKKPAREEFSVPLGADGEHLEIVTGKSERVSGDLHVVNQLVGELHSSIGAVLQAEQTVLAGFERDYEEVKKATPFLENLSHGQLLVNSVIACDKREAFISGRRSGADLSGFGGQSHRKSVDLSASLLSDTSGFTSDVTVDRPAIPNHAGWFSWTKVHTLEKRGLPEFFNGKSPRKTGKIYMNYRNIILNKYRENVKQLITVADVQDLLAGLDEKTISRVLEFLDHWGLINYQAPAECRPVWQSPDLSVDSDMSGLLRALPSKRPSLYEFDSVQAPVCKPGYVSSKPADVAVPELLARPGQDVDHLCISCAADCSEQRYHCQKQADFYLCCDCYNDGKFGPDMVSTDFLRMDFSVEENGNFVGWTDRETLSLLEALEIYGDNWNEIAEHVASKSKAQCILHFIRLPVEDSFLEDMETRGTTSTLPAAPLLFQSIDTGQGEQSGEEKAGSLSESSALARRTGEEISSDVQAASSSFVVFADAPNSVMALVAFLAAMVGPRVAAAAAQAALGTLTQKDSGPRLAAFTAMAINSSRCLAPSAVQQPGRLLFADSEFRSSNDANLLSTPESGSVGGMSVRGYESVTAFKPGNLGHPSAGPGGAHVSRTLVNGNLIISEDLLGTGHVKHATVNAMAAAAVKAKLLADQEEREMQRLVTIVIEHQLKKLELKLKTFNDLEIMLSKESESVERARQKIYSEHARMVAVRLGTTSGGRAKSPTLGTGTSWQAGGIVPRPAGYAPYAPSGQASQMLTPGLGASFEGKNPQGSGPSPGMQGLVRPVTAGTMSAPQGQIMRVGTVRGATPSQIVGQTAMPQGSPVTPSPQTCGLLSLPSASPGPHTTLRTQPPGRPLTAPSGMSRPAPGGTSVKASGAVQ